MEFKKKYIKYKNKYIQLKYDGIGGSSGIYEDSPHESTNINKPLKIYETILMIYDYLNTIDVSDSANINISITFSDEEKYLNNDDVIINKLNIKRIAKNTNKYTKEDYYMFALYNIINWNTIFKMYKYEISTGDNIVIGYHPYNKCMIVFKLNENGQAEGILYIKNIMINTQDYNQIREKQQLKQHLERTKIRQQIIENKDMLNSYLNTKCDIQKITPEIKDAIMIHSTNLMKHLESIKSQQYDYTSAKNQYELFLFNMLILLDFDELKIYEFFFDICKRNSSIIKKKKKNIIINNNKLIIVIKLIYSSETYNKICSYTTNPTPSVTTSHIYPICTNMTNIFDTLKNKMITYINHNSDKIIKLIQKTE
jgi:hypothetical protein